MQSGQQEFVLKHRLTGAAVLITFAVIVLPYLLGGPPNALEQPPPIMSPDEAATKVFRSKITPIGGATPVIEVTEEPDPGTPTTRDPAPAPEENVNTVVTRLDEPGAGEKVGGDATDEPETVAKVAPKAPEKAAPEPAPEPTTVERGWVVQVGVFRNPENVSKAKDTLKRIGYSASTSPTTTSSGEATKVWVGPYSTRVEAARIRTQIKQKTGTEGILVAFP